MLSQKQLDEIKQHLEKSQNPLFFFDNDVDGLCSFLLLRRWLGRGKGVAVKSFPEVDASYARKVEELGADYVFILDKPLVSEGFFKELEAKNIPVVWIDHHEVEKEAKIPENVSYYNPAKPEKGESKSIEPTTYLCYSAVKNKSDMWLAVAGCISDSFIPDFFEEFIKNNPELAIKSNNAFEILYTTKIGKVIRVLDSALKDRTRNVVLMIKFMSEAKSPDEVLIESKKNSEMLKRFSFIDKKYQELVANAKSQLSENNLLFFQYGGDLSISANISNELSFYFPKKIIVVAYLKGEKANISIRGSNIKKIAIKAIEGFEGATVGGHENACGGRINVEDLPKFKKNLEALLKDGK